MIRKGWKEFRAIKCRRWVLVTYDLLWFVGLHQCAAELLYRELTNHCGISNEVLTEAMK